MKNIKVVRWSNYHTVVKHVNMLLGDIDAILRDMIGAEQSTRFNIRVYKVKLIS